MIKRLTTLFLTKVYIVTAFGFALNLHYCGSVLAAVEINSPAKNCNPLAAMKMKGCKDKKVDVKIKDAHQGESQSLMSKLFGFEMTKIPFGDPAPPAPPPPSGKTSQFIKNCSLRI
jgi:hypothetical protein